MAAEAVAAAAVAEACVEAGVGAHSGGEQTTQTQRDCDRFARRGGGDLRNKERK